MGKRRGDALAGDGDSDGASCNVDNPCTDLGASRCDEENLETCTDDAAGCLAWVLEVCTGEATCQIFGDHAECSCHGCPSPGARQCQGNSAEECT